MPWLANLLPEAQLAEIGQQIKVSPQDVIGLLVQIGRDTAGALSIGTARVPGSHRVEIAGDVALERIINELPAKPFLVGERGVSMSLAGVQQKIALVHEDGRFFVPVDGTPSTHILKPDSPRLPGSVQNEAFCLTLARLCGLNVAEVTTGRAGSRNYLLVTRYDRLRTAKGWARLHQEDFCQLLGYFPARKYERVGPLREAGPGLVDLFAGLLRHASPGERLRLLDGVIANVLIGNTDAHAKNYSILIGAGGSARLAPLYDLMCAAVYPRVDQTMAQQINGRWDAAQLHGFDWLAFARSVGLAPSRTLNRVRELADLFLVRAEEAFDTVAAMPAGGNDILKTVRHAVVKRCRRIARQSEATRTAPINEQTSSS